MFVSINTGSDAFIEGADKITASDLGVRYSGFRSIDRFIEQIKDMHVGLISWPGGTLAEERLGSFGLEYDDLTSDDSKMPSLSQMMQIANVQGTELSVVLPTVRYSGRIDEMRADVQNFMEDLLSGQYGPLPARMIFHIGSEHYHHFQGLSPDGAAAEYGRVASAMVEELTRALNDTSVNLIRADIDLSVQAGRTMQEDENIRDSFSPESLANIDLVMHHRYAARAEGVDFNLKPFSPILDAWQQDVTQAGGDVPQIHLSEWNVASLTRNEGLNSYVRDMAAQGIRVNRGDIDLAGRTNTEFENYWQELLSTRDYGVAVPKLYLELFSEYQAEGLGAASIHAADLMHAGRMTYTDTDGNPVQFVGAEMMKMIYESVEGTQVLKVSTENTRSSDLWTYAYEGDDRLVVFLAADADAMPGNVTVDIEGLTGGYAAIWTDSLTAEVPEDWMARFGVPDNLNVDESNEGQTYAVGVRGDVPTSINGDQVTVTFSQPGQVVRIVVAQTRAEAELIEEWAGAPDFTTAAPTGAQAISGATIAEASSFSFPEIDATNAGSNTVFWEQAMARCFVAPEIFTRPVKLAQTSSEQPHYAPLGQDQNPPAATQTDTTEVPSGRASDPQPDAPTARGPDNRLPAEPAALDDDLLPRLPIPQEDHDEPDHAEEDSATQSSVAEIATLTGSAFGAALMAILASMASFGV